LIPLGIILFNHHIGVGLGGGGEGGELGASEVANLLTHASLPSSRKTCNQSPFTSITLSEVPFLALPITL
jgi:hypothetical protein